jgi:hypothetical protein
MIRTLHNGRGNPGHIGLQSSCPGRGTLRTSSSRRSSRREATRPAAPRPFETRSLAWERARLTQTTGRDPTARGNTGGTPGGRQGDARGTPGGTQDPELPAFGKGSGPLGLTGRVPRRTGQHAAGAAPLDTTMASSDPPAAPILSNRVAILGLNWHFPIHKGCLLFTQNAQWPSTVAP